jgi:hypothetical protein
MKMSAAGNLVQKFLSKKKIETVSDVGGQIHGISLPSFLQMSEMEGCHLYPQSDQRQPHRPSLSRSDGSLIAARMAIIPATMRLTELSAGITPPSRSRRPIPTASEKFTTPSCM